MNSLEQDEPNTQESNTETIGLAGEEAQAVTAVEAVQQGAAHARSAAERFVPGVGRLVTRSVYRICYYAAYGVVFTALTIAQLVPTNNLRGNALKDGARAAKDAIGKRRTTAAPEPEEACADTEDVVVAA